MKKQAVKEITEEQRRIGIAARNKQNKAFTNRVLAEKSPWTIDELVDWVNENDKKKSTKRR